MADDLNLNAELNVDAKGFIADLDRLIDKVNRLGSSLGITDKGVDKLDRTLNSARTQVSGVAKSAGDAAASQSKLNSEFERSENSLSRARYALYDVSTTYAAISAAALGTVAAVGTVSAAYESSFTSVERTSLTSAGNVRDGIGQIKEGLLDLSEQIPVTFDQLTKIATLGNQLGIAGNSIVDFTKNVSQFAAVTGISVDTAAEGFGRIGQLLGVPADQFDSLASAILYAGNTSVATEADVLSYAERLSAVTAQYGASAQEVVAFASVLASTANGLEASQGAFQRIFQGTTAAISEGGDKLAAFAALSGQTSDEFAKAWGDNPVQAFNKLLGTLSKLDAQQRQTAYNALGFVDTREVRTLNNLANQYDTLQKQLKDVSGVYAEGTYVSKAYAIVLDDVASQFTILLNAVQRFAVTAGQPFLEFLRTALPLATQLFQNFTDFAGTDIGRNVLQFSGALLAVIGVIAAYRGALALATASTFALKIAQVELAKAGVGTGLLGLARSILGIDSAARTSATGVAVLSGAFRLLGRALLIGFIAEAVSLFIDLSNGSVDAANTVKGAIGFVVDAIGQGLIALVSLQNEIGKSFDPLRKFLGMSQLQLDVGRQNNIDQVQTGIENTKKILTSFIPDLKKTKSATDATEDSLNNLGGTSDSIDDASGALDGLGSAAGGTAAEVRTLVDYANDLGTVFKRAFDIRFASGTALDNVSKSFSQIAQQAADAAKEINDLNAEIGKLRSDREIQAFFLTIAEGYNDTLRAGKIRANLADIDSQLADKSADLNKAQGKQNKTLVGNTDNAIDNRAAILQIVQQYSDYINSLAASGASQDELNAAVEYSRQAFYQQATALGFSRAQLEPYARAFDDLSTSIARIPRNITVAANVDPALQALNELEARAKSISGQTYAGPSFSAGDSKGSRQLSIQAQIDSITKRIQSLSGTNAYGALSNLELELVNLRNQLASGSFSGGGYTGAGGKFDPAGVVHRGEYVIPKKDVNQSTGLPYADAFGRVSRGFRGNSGYAGGGYVGGSGGFGATDPRILRLLGIIAERTGTYIGSDLVGAAANNSDVNAAHRRSN